MVICAIIGCGNRSERDKGAYCSLPKVRLHEGPQEQQRSEDRRRLWLKAIARDDLTDSKMQYEKVCWKHFISGKSHF